jgi:hypothetical protein
LSARGFEANVDYFVSMALMKPLRLAFGFALLSIIMTGQAAEPSASITLEGILEVGEFYGPPNYGEDPRGDRIEHSLYLQLPTTPNTQIPDPNALAMFGPDAQRTYFVQLVVHDPEHSAAEKAIGHKVQIMGVPFEPVTGHHRTALLIDVRSLKPIDAWSWQPAGSDLSAGSTH